MRQRTRTAIALGAVAALGLGTTAALVGSASAETIPKTALGLSSNGKSLKTFSLTTGAQVKALGGVSGLAGDTTLIGIDQRPSNHKFYGVGNAGGIYTISSSTGAAVKVSQLSVALNGTHFGVDFNPAADRLRIVSNTGQSLRHDVSMAAPATAVDGTLNYPVGNPPTPGPTATGITGAAYTNNDAFSVTSTGTTLFDLDTTLDRVAQQVPANSGTLVVSGPFGGGVGPISGFDIVTTVSSNGTATGNVGFATLRPTSGGLGGLYKVDLLSGDVTKVAGFNHDVADLAIPQP